MKGTARKSIIGMAMVLLLAAGVGFSESGQPPSPPEQALGPGSDRPAAASLWRYCRTVNPESPSCREFMGQMREHWKKMRELRERIWAEMKEYCKSHTKEAFCKRLHEGSSWSCPCPRCSHHREG